MIRIKLRDGLSPALRRLVAQAQSPSLMQAAGQHVVVLLRQHFRHAEQTRPNRHGWPRQHFWAQFARRIALGPTTASRTVVQIQDPQGALQHKITGGTIRPKRGRALAIPLTGEAYRRGAKARIPDAFPDAFVLRTATGAWIVRARYQTRGTGRKRSGVKGQRLEFLFRLVPQVTHAPDPQALPTADQLRTAAVAGVRAWLARRTPSIG